MFVVLLLSSFLASTVHAACPANSKEYDNQCYAFLGTDYSYSLATSLCPSTFDTCSHLPVVANAAQNNYLTSLVQNHGGWSIWLQYTANGDYYVDASGHPPVYTKWAIGEPFSNSVGYCATLSMNGFWYAQPCANSVRPLCQMDKVCSPPTTTTTQPPPYSGFPQCVLNYMNYVPCQSGWTYFPQACSCYKVLTNTTYYSAMNTCRSQGGNLASIHSFAEAAFITRLAAQTNSNWTPTVTWKDNIIVGLNTNGSHLVWDDGTKFDFPQIFAPGEPSNFVQQGQLVLTSPAGYSTYLKMADCSYNYCRYAVCQIKVK
ncbi:unnamed protein product [Caenorhabditis auriculariae]|uniref:C-type lectin domain-containing protein n=1 Tax=Caenorhabditis auriculariae TaxID=2777116 RepID=A0A8S1H0P1_9PELO|nr:unnamed protein product [Caenorhabditis auriculariae]